MGIFSIVYLFFILVGISLFDFMTRINARILSPVLGCVIVSACVLGASAGPKMRAIAAAIGAALIVQWMFGSAALLRTIHREGLGYAAPKWLQSQTLHAVHRMPKDQMIYSNAWDVISLLDDRPAQTLPPRIVGVTGRPSPNFDHDMQIIADQVKNHGAVIVFFHNMKTRPTLPSETEVRATMPLRTLLRKDDGVICTSAAP
jgi:hypothetical protein